MLYFTFMAGSFQGGALNRRKGHMKNTGEVLFKGTFRFFTGPFIKLLRIKQGLNSVNSIKLNIYEK